MVCTDHVCTCLGHPNSRYGVIIKNLNKTIVEDKVTGQMIDSQSVNPKTTWEGQA